VARVLFGQDLQIRFPRVVMVVAVRVPAV